MRRLTYTTPLFPLTYAKCWLYPVAVHYHILVFGLAATVLPRPLIMQPVLLNHVADVLQLLLRENQIVEQQADFVFRRHPRWDWLRALLLPCCSYVRLGKIVARTT
jgi:hypothetical protein